MSHFPWSLIMVISIWAILAVGNQTFQATVAKAQIEQEVLKVIGKNYRKELSRLKSFRSILTAKQRVIQCGATTETKAAYCDFVADAEALLQRECSLTRATLWERCREDLVLGSRQAVMQLCENNATFQARVKQELGNLLVQTEPSEYFPYLHLSSVENMQMNALRQWIDCNDARPQAVDLTCQKLNRLIRKATSLQTKGTRNLAVVAAALNSLHPEPLRPCNITERTCGRKPVTPSVTTTTDSTTKLFTEDSDSIVRTKIHPCLDDNSDCDEWPTRSLSSLAREHSKKRKRRQIQEIWLRGGNPHNCHNVSAFITTAMEQSFREGTCTNVIQRDCPTYVGRRHVLKAALKKLFACDQLKHDELRSFLQRMKAISWLRFPLSHYNGRLLNVSAVANITYFIPGQRYDQVFTAVLLGEEEIVHKTMFNIPLSTILIRNFMTKLKNHTITYH